jgi:hypothetical protein
VRRLLVLVVLGTACVEEPVVEDPFPTILFRADHRATILERIDRAPYSAMTATLRERAAREYDEGDPDEWSHGANGRNAETAKAAAMLAWLFDDADEAAIARDFLSRIPTDYETHRTWDINIRMPHPLMGWVDTIDLLRATSAFSDAEYAAARDALTLITGKFFDEFLGPDGTGGLVLRPAQNNHPIRTASAIGYVAMAFPEYPQSAEWLDWATSELDYLWGPDGRYVQADGGVSEGPFYFGFAWGVSTAFFIGWDNLFGDGRGPAPELHRDCRNRSETDPWTGHGCVDGAAFSFDNPLWSERYRATVDWSMSLRLPSGHRPPLADAYFNPFNGGALLSSFGGGGHYRWDWESNVDRPHEMGHGADLVAHHLGYFDDSIEAEEPPWTSRFLPDAGNAIFRSDHSHDAVWGLLLGEAGAARKTLHDHVDGTSFTVAAYGEYLLIDPGYYKPTDLDNAETAQSPSHNLVLVDGRAAPNKGLLTNFGDADAVLQNWHDGAWIDYAEAVQDYGGTAVERSVAFVRDRYFVIADRLSTDDDGLHDYSFRMHGGSGATGEGTFQLTGDGARWELSAAGLDLHVVAVDIALTYEEPPFEENAAPHVDKYRLDRSVGSHAVLDAVTRDQGTAPWFLAIAAPYRVGGDGDDAALDVQSIGDPPAGWAGWTVSGDGWTDIVLAHRPGASESWGTVTLDGVFGVCGEGFGLVAAGSRLVVDGIVCAEGASAAILVNE